MNIRTSSLLSLVLATSFSSSLWGREELCLTPEVVDSTPLKAITTKIESSALLDCAKELYNHKSVPPESKGNYWHNINGNKFFAKQCWSLDKHGEKEIIYSFLGEDGLQVLKFPVYNYKEGSIETSLPRNIMRFKSGGKNYLLSQFDNVGEYFDSLEEENLAAFVKKRGIMGNSANIKKKYVDGYDQFLTKHNAKTPELRKPGAGTISSEEAASCIRERLEEYVSIIWYKNYPEALPYIGTMNDDIKRTDRSAEEVFNRYSKSPDQKLEEMTKSIFPENSSCRSVISEKNLKDIFQKNYGSRMEHFNNVRRYFSQFNDFK